MRVKKTNVVLQTHVRSQDIKPSNLLLTNNDKLLISDFGIARVLQDTLKLQMTTFAGTVQYAAPELFDHELMGGLTSAVDVWSAACVVAEMFTGMPPFDGATLPVGLHLFKSPTLNNCKKVYIHMYIEYIFLTTSGNRL